MIKSPLKILGSVRIKWHVTTGLCAGVVLEFRPPVTAARLFAKDKCLEPMFGDVGHARTNAAMLLLPIATTSSRTCTKPIVSGSFYRFFHLDLILQQAHQGFQLWLLHRAWVYF